MSAQPDPPSAPTPDSTPGTTSGTTSGRPARRPGGPVLVAVVVVAVVAAALWAYLSNSRGVEPAADAGDPACTTLLGRLPQTLGALSRTTQGAAGVAVWGEQRIVLRCGALVLGPTTKACIPVGPDAGPSVDWVQDAHNDRAVRFLTYGRTPAVEVTVRFGDGLTSDQATSQLIDLAEAVSAIPQTRTCL